MKSKTEVTLSVIDGCSASDRVQVVLCQDTFAGSKIEVRQQSWGDGVGWFTQSSIQFEPHQFRELCGTIGATSRTVSTAPPKRPNHPQQNPPAFSPRVLHADSA